MFQFGRKTRTTVLWLASLCCLLGASCRSVTPEIGELPRKHTLNAEQLVLMSDVRLPKDHDLIKDLQKLRHTVQQKLQLTSTTQEVVVYLFKDEKRYRDYLNTTYPQLPARRAYFVGTPHELAVYTYWGDRIQEDLRHEYTHGLLHASLRSVPLWLDEGLAEYFEVPGPETGGMNTDYVERLGVTLANGWTPDMKRLEQLEQITDMQRIDYQEAWLWVHYLLHNSPETHMLLIDYLKDLSGQAEPVSLSQRLEENIPYVEERLIGYLSGLSRGAVSTVSFEE